MEQKKILWVLVSVTLFLFIVAITGVIWFYPDKDSIATSGQSGSGKDAAAVDFDPVEWVREGELFPGLTESSKKTEEGFVIVYGETEEGELAVDLVNGIAAEGHAQTGNNVTAKQSTTKAAESVKEPLIEAVKEAGNRTTQVAAPVPKKVNVLEYWIQAGSFESRSTAENASKSLAEKGFSNLVTIKTVETNDFFRVRMGPYHSYGEAEKFLGWIKDIDSYDKSYISEVYVQKTVN